MAKDWSNKIFHLTLWGLNHRQIKGKAVIAPGIRGVRVTIEFDTDDADLIACLLEEGVKEPEIGQEYHIENVEREAIERFKTHEHNPVKHYDGKPKWCDICGLTASGKRPYPYRGATNQKVEVDGRGRVSKDGSK
jgi:hypothetical protein